MPNGKCTITIDGSYSGEWIVPCNQVQYIEENTLINYSSSNINLYKSLGNNYPRISLGFNQQPIYYQSNQVNGVYITNITNTKFNIDAQLQRISPVSNLLIFGAILFSCLVLLMRSKKI